MGLWFSRLRYKVDSCLIFPFSITELESSTKFISLKLDSFRLPPVSLLFICLVFFQESESQIQYETLRFCFCFFLFFYISLSIANRNLRDFPRTQSWEAGKRGYLVGVRRLFRRFLFVLHLLVSFDSFTPVPIMSPQGLANPLLGRSRIDSAILE